MNVELRDDRLDSDAVAPQIQGFAFRGPDSLPVLFDPS